MDRNKSLSVEIKDGQLQISVGINILKHAAETSLDHRLCWHDELTSEFVSHKVINIEEFAENVLQALLEEDRDGTTAVHVFLDGAFIKAIEDGSLAVSELPEKAVFRPL